MSRRQDQSDGPTRLLRTTGEFARPRSPRTRIGSAIYHPTAVFRRLLDESVRVRTITGVRLDEFSSESELDKRAPSLLSFLGVAFLLSVASGLLELAVREIQVHFLHRVDWHSLMVSRHVTWMVPLTAPLVIMPLAVIVAWPAVALLTWRSRRGKRQSLGVACAWGWAGTVLGTLFLIGPLLAIRALHPAAAVVLAVGVGFRVWRWLVRPIAGWRRLSYSGAGITLVVLPAILFAHWNVFIPAPETTRSRPIAGSPNLLWIVVDTLRADRMSLYGYVRRTTPELEAWAKEGITFEMARSAAPWTLPSHVTMFTGLWPSEHARGLTEPIAGLLRRWPSIFVPMAIRRPGSWPMSPCATPPTAWGADSTITSTTRVTRRSA